MKRILLIGKEVLGNYLNKYLLKNLKLNSFILKKKKFKKIDFT